VEGKHRSGGVLECWSNGTPKRVQLTAGQPLLIISGLIGEIIYPMRIERLPVTQRHQCSLWRGYYPELCHSNIPLQCFSSTPILQYSSNYPFMYYKTTVKKPPRNLPEAFKQYATRPLDTVAIIELVSYRTKTIRFRIHVKAVFAGIGR